MLFVAFRCIVIVSAFLLVHVTQCRSQQRDLSPNDFYSWPRLSDPRISPKGVYCAYVVENSPVGYNTIVVRSISGGWSRSYTIAPRYFNGVLTDEALIFSRGPDTVLVSKLGGGELIYSRARNFKVDEGLSQLICISMDDRFVVLQNGKEVVSIGSVVDYFFLNDGKQILLVKDADNGEKVVVQLNIRTKKEIEIWRGKSVSGLIISRDFSKAAFHEKTEGETSSSQIVIIDFFRNDVKEFPVGSAKYEVAEIRGFSKDQRYLVIGVSINDTKLTDVKNDDVRVWSFTDNKPRLDDANFDLSIPKLISLNVNSGKVIEVENGQYNWLLGARSDNCGDPAVVWKYNGDCYREEVAWNSNCTKSWYKVSLENGERALIPELDGRSSLNSYILSPDGKYIVFFDKDKSSYFSYCLESSLLSELTQHPTREIFNRQPENSSGYLPFGQRGIGGWGIDGKTVYIYDRTDIWCFALDANIPPKCITNGYGRSNNIVFSFLDENTVVESENIVLTAFSDLDKKNGFYSISNKHVKDPMLIHMADRLFYQPYFSNHGAEGMAPLKAKLATKYIVLQQSSYQYPNFYYTPDFKTFKEISNIHPETEVKWLKTELINFSVNSGKKVSGILYKPQFLDTASKYPLVFNVYEQLSNSLNAFPLPNWIDDGCEINAPFMVSKGYLVFQPDIYYKADSVGEAALDIINAAVDRLGAIQWVDKTHMGIQGCSFGGFETNYVVTHSKLFKAACSASAVSDLMAWASIKYKTVYTSFFFQQYRMSSMFWKAPESYVLNSPIFYADRIQTPLLLFHTSIDDAVPFNQGVQFFLTLRRLKKPSWLLEYGGSANHGVMDQKQAADFGKRMLSFFDFYLRGKDAPDWMNLNAEMRK